MIDISELTTSNLATLSAIVAALVTVIGNTFKLPSRYRSLLAIVISTIFVFIPPLLLNKILTALIIGLTASGVYSHVKQPNPFSSFNKGNKKKQVRKETQNIEKASQNDQNTEA